MATNTLKTRVKHKIGTASDWQTAVDNSQFKPLDGELIIYADATTPRLKVGYDSKLVTELPFIDGIKLTVSGSGNAINAASYDENTRTLTLTKGASYTNNTGDITGVIAGKGLTGGATSGTATVKAKLRSETALTIDSVAATTTSDRVYPVAVDKTGYLAVNVPWTDNDTTSFTITASASDDDVVNLTGTNGTNKVTYVASHAKKGPSSGYTSGNTTTSISGAGSEATIKIPQLTVDSYGHVTAAADESVTIKIPSASDLGLSGAMRFLGTSATAIADGETTNPITIGSTSTTVSSGNVVLYGKKEFVWTGSVWEELGNEGSYKIQQTAVSSPSTSGSTTAFIDTISQNAQGVITATKKNVSFPTLSGGSAAANDATVVGGVTVSGHAVTVGKKTLTAGNNVSITGGTSTITIAATDTTYNAATQSTAGLMSADDKKKLDSIASGATANTGDITGVTAGVGIAGGATSGTATVKAKLRSETALTVDSAAATTTSGRVYPVAIDKTGYLAVNVPWTDTNTNTNYYHTPSYTSGLNIATGTGVNTLYVPDASGSQKGVTVVYPAAECTTYTSDIGTVTPAAVKKAVGLFALDNLGGTMGGDIYMSNGQTTQAGQPCIYWKTWGTNSRNPFMGYAEDQSDGTFMVASVEGRNYANGLAIGGASGNLIWKGKRVLTTNDAYTLPAATSSALGGVKVGSNITVSSGTISLSKANVVAALGYTPPTTDTNTNTTYDFAASTSSANGNVKLNLTAGGSGSGTDSVTIKGTGATTVTTDSNGVVTINTGASSVTLNGSATTSANFYAPTTAGTNGYVLTSNGSGAPSWKAAYSYTLPTASSTLGGVKTTSKVTSTSGLTACPIISGVVYYKDTNTQAVSSVFGRTGAVTLTKADVTTALGYTPPTTNTNTTYTFATGSTNGTFTVTPSGGTAQSVSIKGLGSNAYTSTSYLPLAGGTLSGPLTTASHIWAEGQITVKDSNIVIQDSNYPSMYFYNSDASTTLGRIYINSTAGECAPLYLRVYQNASTYHTAYLNTDGSWNATTVKGAVWNDYAEFRATVPNVKPGQVVIENGDGTLRISTERLQPGSEVVSDTFGFAIGETDECKTPVAASGRVLAYPYEDRTTFVAGEPVCSGPNGTVSRMTREEAKEYPERIIGTVSEIPTYETWGTGNVKVNGRIWIKVK